METELGPRLVALAALFAFTACGWPSNDGGTSNTERTTGGTTAPERILDFEDFNEVAVGSGMRVQIEQAADFRVEVDGSEEALEKLKVEKDGDELRFFFDRNLIDRAVQWEDHKVTVSIRMPELRSLDLGGGATGEVAMETSVGRFEADLSGGSRLEGSVSAGAMELDLSSGSQITLAGETGSVSLDGSSGSAFDLEGLVAEEVTADLSSGSTARVRTDGVINVDLNSGSKVIYHGNPQLGDVELSSGGDLERAQ